MGVDFVRKATPAFKKALDKARADLGTPDLFKQHPGCEPRSYSARILTNRVLAPDDTLSVRHHDGKIVAQRGMDIVAEFDSPPAELVEAVKASFGEACGIVQQVHDIAGMAEISVC